MKVFWIVLSLSVNLLAMGQTNGSQPTSLTTVIEFGGRVKVNCHKDQRQEVKDFFGSTLGLKIESQAHYDRVFFDGGGFVAFVYTEAEMVLSPEGFIKGMQVGLFVPTQEAYEHAKGQAKQFGIEEYYPPYIPNKNQDQFFYFRATKGGQIFRLVNGGHK